MNISLNIMLFLFCNILRIGRQHIFKQFIYLKLNAMQQYSIDEIFVDFAHSYQQTQNI